VILVIETRPLFLFTHMPFQKIAELPPCSMHQHFNDDPQREARIIVVTNRILKEMDFHWFDQLEHAEGCGGL
jgi:hypothetical protein